MKEKMQNFSKKYFTPDVRRIVVGVLYLILIGVVVYGMEHHVYDGFGKAVPWIIIVLFGIMGAVRITEGIKGKSFLELVSEVRDRIGQKSDETDK